MVTDHPFLDAVVFDLATTTYPTPAPALYRHYDEVGVIESAAAREGISAFVERRRADFTKTG
jgi:hypothetical protein